MRAAFTIIVIAVLATNALIAAVHMFEPRYLAMQAPMFVMLGFLATLVVVNTWCPLFQA